ncbi:MAG: aminoacyl-tRNA hydrolase [Candidatus Aminicenantes bacterium]|nr:aminoacyl-tRNA hydrolase [Candidatus Aminicenantes bacterium]
MWAVVGLGNPGRRYVRTRHNAGYFLIKRVAKLWGGRIKKRAFGAKVKYVEHNGKAILLAMPQTFMNKSGLAVKQMVDSGGVALENLVVVYDDLDIPLGEIRIRKEGGAGSHKGMRSVIEELNSNRFTRIRIGIGPLPPDVEATEYVLSVFSADEEILLERGLEKAQEALQYIFKEETEKAMSLFNQRFQDDSGKP